MEPARTLDLPDRMHLPHRPEWESWCPRCGHLNTVYVPAERRGACGDCGFVWHFFPYSVHLERFPWELPA